MELLFTEQLDRAQTKQQLLSLLEIVSEEKWVFDLIKNTWLDDHVGLFVNKWFLGNIDELHWDVNRFTSQYIEKGSVLEH
ncbi:hypothetical protein [Paenibacillus cremeus]|uniref:Uncharacterized protein n=1 Tax=Paenibacillus cremeus TaxID=2163881 RepID=A0A559KCX3_9BACL|nr:hypothetical protein [Paenibacillus cremeus]TVY09981.1 hypothetical protein FPZ49_11460 [Paenibacillus cremeus]